MTKPYTPPTITPAGTLHDLTQRYDGPKEFAFRLDASRPFLLARPSN